jgi:hypothetical protein
MKVLSSSFLGWQTTLSHGRGSNLLDNLSITLDFHSYSALSFSFQMLERSCAPSFPSFFLPSTIMATCHVFQKASAIYHPQSHIRKCQPDSSQHRCVLLSTLARVCWRREVITWVSLHLYIFPTDPDPRLIPPVSSVPFWINGETNRIYYSWRVG